MKPDPIATALTMAQQATEQLALATASIADLTEIILPDPDISRPFQIGSNLATIQHGAARVYFRSVCGEFESIEIDSCDLSTSDGVRSLMGCLRVALRWLVESEREEARDV